MGDIALRGPDVKKFVKLAKKRDMNFAYCPGNDPKEDVFVLDRKKKPEVIGRTARGEGTGTKAAIGTARVKGRVMTLTCLKELPQMAKKLKKFLKSEKVPMNIVIMDTDGNVIDQDIEDLPFDPELDEVDGDENEIDAEDNAEEAARRLAALTARARDLQKSILALPKTMQAPITKGFQAVLTILKKGDLDKAEGMLAKLETSAEMLAAKAAAAPVQDAKPGADLGALSEDAKALARRIDALGSAEGAARLRTAHDVLTQQIAAGDAKKATGMMKALQDALARTEAQSPPADQKPTDAQGAWAAAQAELVPVVNDLLDRNLGDVSKMRAVRDFFLEKGAAGEFGAAMKAVPGLRKLIAAAEAAPQSEVEAAIPPGVVPYYKARMDWGQTRSNLTAEMTKLQKAIIDTCDANDFPDVKKETGQLFDYLVKLDTRLENALEALEKEPDADKREKLKGAAAAVLAEYKRELDTDFFKAVDGDNGFIPVNVRGAAITSLRKVEDALSSAAA